MTDIKPIETRYAGCLFRSRLEARWAVFFDTLGIEWQYEAQGYECTTRCQLSGDGYDNRFRYLPDFWLPGLGLHAEVKASLTEPDLRRLLDAAADLSENGHDLVIFGQIPRPWPGPYETHRTGTMCVVPWRCHLHKGTLYAERWLNQPGGRHGSFRNLVAYDTGEWGDAPPEVLTRLLVHGAACWERHPEFDRGYQAARSARFEHGESGAPQPRQTAAERREQLFESILRDRGPGQFGGPGRWTR